MYVKWFDTVMFYYVILVMLVNVTFCHIQISRRSVPVHPDASRGRNPDDRCRHPPDYIARDTAGGTLRERRTRYVKNRSQSSAAWYSRV
ncbi:unnamed protein product [Staurois parvus]|uniref:Secreted protein n=1 Tax=Staurois parvus TaxID=386267 RepID=A0ABN9CZB9_9NEOB|nr:unnamed protein product [Staurois parvus]